MKNISILYNGFSFCEIRYCDYQEQEKIFGQVPLYSHFQHQSVIVEPPF